jgi:hypothetical protein
MTTHGKIKTEKIDGEAGGGPGSDTHAERVLQLLLLLVVM